MTAHSQVLGVQTGTYLLGVLPFNPLQQAYVLVTKRTLTHTCLGSAMDQSSSLCSGPGL